MPKKIVLAYSGGLDTSVIMRWLKETYRWYLRNNTFPKPDYSFEDALIEAAPASAYSLPAD